MRPNTNLQPAWNEAPRWNRDNAKHSKRLANAGGGGGGRGGTAANSQGTARPADLSQGF